MIKLIKNISIAYDVQTYFNKTLGKYQRNLRKSQQTKTWKISSKN